MHAPSRHGTLSLTSLPRDRFGVIGDLPWKMSWHSLKRNILVTTEFCRSSAIWMAVSLRSFENKVERCKHFLNRIDITYQKAWLHDHR